MDYHIYRSTNPIYSFTGLNLIATTTDTHFHENITETGHYFYVVTAINSVFTSLLSNNVNVEVNLVESSVISQVSSLLNNTSLNVTASKGGFLGYNYLAISSLFVLTFVAIIIKRKRINI